MILDTTDDEMELALALVGVALTGTSGEESRDLFQRLSAQMTDPSRAFEMAGLVACFAALLVEMQAASAGTTAAEALQLTGRAWMTRRPPDHEGA